VSSDLERNHNEGYIDAKLKKKKSGVARELLPKHNSKKAEN